MSKKFIKIAVLTPALIVALAVVSIFAFQGVRHILVEENEVLVHSVAQSILPALLINDTQQVEALMKALESYPGVQAAELVNAEGAPIASYARAGQHLDPLSPTFELASVADDSNQVHVMAPITFDSLIVANLHIAVNLWPIYLRIMTWLGVLLIVPSAMYVLVKQLRIKIRFEKVSSDNGSGHGDRSFDVNATTSQALSDADISLEYQPIRRLSDGGLFGMEVVACWRHPSGQTLYISPADFVALAKKTDIFLPFDNWLLTTACEKAAAWQHQYGPLILTINVSEAQFKDPAFPQKIREVCEATQYPHQLLELEVSESILSRQSQIALKTIQGFASRGLSISVRGFGLQQSSLQLMDMLPLNKIKLDRKLVMSMTNDSRIGQLIEATITHALSRDVQVVSDGVESAQQRAELQRMGSILGQGAYFDPPLAVREFEVLLRSRTFEKSGNEIFDASLQPHAGISRTFATVRL